MSFLLDPIESGINSLLEPLTSSPTATSSDDEVVPVETSTTDVGSKTTSNSKSKTTLTPSLAAASTSTTTAESSASSARARTTSSSDSTTATSSQTTTTSEDSSTTSLPTTTTATTLSTSTTSSSITSSSTGVPPAPSAAAQPTLSPAQSTSDNSSPTSSSGSGFSTAGIVVAAIFAAGLLISIIWLTIRFCPPVRKRIDAWYERRREERTWRAALDGPAVEKGSLSSAGTSTTDPTRPFSFFALGKNPQLHGDTTNSNTYTETRGLAQPRQSYVSPTSAEIYTPVSARPGNNAHGLGLGRVSLLRNTSLLRKAGFDAPPNPPPPQLPLSMTTSSPTTHQHDHPRVSIAQPIRAMKPSMSQIKRKPLPANPPGVTSESGMGGPPRMNSAPVDRGVVSGPVGHAARGRGGSRDGLVPRLQIRIPGPPPGLAEVERVSQIGLAVTGSPAVRGTR